MSTEAAQLRRMDRAGEQLTLRVNGASYDPARNALLDARQVESLILNLDASLKVHTRPQLFSWTQGLLQSLIPHKVLICALRSGEPMSFRVDSFSTAVPDAGIFGGFLLHEASVAPCLIKAWKQRRCLPVSCDAADLNGIQRGAFVRELTRIDATQLLVHGSHDVDGEVRSLYVFACDAATAGPEQLYVLQLAVPFLHAAWIRSQARRTTTDGARVAPVGAGVLTAREREILRWIYLGKSNGEVGTILQISPLTVKNHVQKILRKLDVVNRAQAVGKALDAQIISP